MADYNFLLETRLSQDQRLALLDLQRVCREAALNVYLTGGPMRDLISGRPVRFLEFTTEGNPMGLSATLKAAGAEHLSPHPDRSSLNLSLRGCRLRIRAAKGAANGGKAAPGTIVEDLRLRGLTLNSIGLSLNPGSRGLPLDPTNGTADIEARLIRMNHSYVFLEDPIVILRAVRLRTRLEFELEERTAARLESAREGEYLERATPAARGQELEAVAYEPDPAAVLRAWEKDNWLEAAFGKNVRTAKMNLGALARLSAVVESWEQLGLTIDSGLAAMPLILGGLGPADQTRLAEMLLSRHLANDWKKIPAEAKALEKKLLAVSGSSGSQFLRKTQEIIEPASPEAVVYASLEPTQAKAGKRLKDFQTEALALRRRLPLGILRAVGIAPHSLEAEGVLRPFYRRLLAGEALSDADLSEGLRAAALILRPPPVVVKPEFTPAAPRGRKKGAPPKVVAKPAPAPPAATPAPVKLAAPPLPAKPAAAAAPAKSLKPAKPGKPQPAKLVKPSKPSPAAAKARPAAKKSTPKKSKRK